MAVTANQITKRQGRDGGRVKVPVAASKRLYGGTLCFLDAGGDASDVINTDVGLFCGIVVDEVNNTGADAAISVEVWTDGVFELPMSGADLVLADLGKTVYAVDNFSLSETAANQPVVGTIVGIVSTSVARVRINGLGNGIMVAPT
jgi:predicted RecA/RadA family phage recombinase